MRLKLKKYWTTRETTLQMFNAAFLRDTNEFRIVLNNRLQDFQDLLKKEETTIENNWKVVKEASTSVLGGAGP
ncbi:unnamed protein product [Schistosoma mattheei]|uniref:Uncharacterized protein n=1 Tax=Schistosoma mattheei TaxID=31246 RepID=A0A183PZQ3_9TREM|nr:unnamed protein product [Schistosoma mattheei]